ncbi:MAG: serine protease [Akkermansiaceae bacterium]|nr:serine protease [Akkermansiaceae bacterium]MCF7731815.1 serine protease [Akkermansiaceae bacterium]
MKFRTLLLTALIASPFAAAATGPLKETALALSASNKESIVQLSATVEIEITAGEMPTKKEEKKLEVIGTVLNKDGLIVVPLSTLDVASAVDGRTVNTQAGPLKLAAKCNTKEVKIIMADGTEVPAKVVFKDADLDLAFVRPEKPEGLTFVPVDTANNAPLGMLHDLVVLGRLGKDLNREPVIMTAEVIAMITKPRTFARIGAPCLGLPVFNSEGKFVGIGINRFSPKSDEMTTGAGATNVVLPAEDVIEAAAQAK